MIEQIVHNNQTLAIIVRGDYNQQGVSFFTPNNYSQQLAFIRHPNGKMIQPHFHNPVSRQVEHTNEVLFLRKGTLRVDFYDTNCNYVKSRILEAGDVILLTSGGHGFKVIEEVEMFEVKQGPYVGDNDKTRFKVESQTLRFD